MSYYRKVGDVSKGYRKVGGTSIDAMVGETITRIVGFVKGSTEVEVMTESGKKFVFEHHQDCCEHVDLYDLEGDPLDMDGALIVSAEEVSNDNEPIPDEDAGYFDESHTWTFYKIETNKGGLWMRWLGESNGYYSEAVDIDMYEAVNNENQ